MALKILLAEGNVAAQTAGKKILLSGGHDVIAVSNGMAALKKISEAHPDIALLDVYMAGCTGVEVCKKVKASAELAQMPILLTVGKMEPFAAGEAIKIKADGLITKPFEVANLITVVEKLGAGRTGENSAAGRQPPPSIAAESRVYQPRIAQPVAAPAQVRSQPGPAHRLHGGELCDVCGHVNQGESSVCERCDVPLPSTVRVHQ